MDRKKLGLLLFIAVFFIMGRLFGNYKLSFFMGISIFVAYVSGMNK